MWSRMCRDETYRGLNWAIIVRYQPIMIKYITYTYNVHKSERYGDSNILSFALERARRHTPRSPKVRSGPTFDREILCFSSLI